MNPNCDELKFVLAENPLSSRFEFYRKNKKFTDVKIKIESLEMDAHRIVLEDASPVIKAMFIHDGNVLEFQKEFVDPEILEDLLNFFYNAHIKITSENALSLCIASDFLHISNLLEKCEKFLSSKVCFENVVDFHILSSKYQFKNLKQSCARFFSSENKNIFENDKLLSLNFEEIKEILEKIKFGNEDDEVLKEKMFHFVISWIENDPNREFFLPNFLKLLPIEKLSHAFLMEHLSSHPLLDNSLSCSRLLIDALGKTRLTSDSKPIYNFSYLHCLSFKIEDDNYSYFISKIDFTNGKCEGSWKVPLFRNHYGGIVLRKKIYFCGGWTGEEKLNKLEEFDCESNTWTELAPMPNAQDHIAMATLNEHIFVAGGNDDFDNSLSTVLKYSPSTDTWAEVKEMNEARYDHELVSLEDAIYAIGGDSSNTVECYKPSTNEWNYVAPMRKERSNFSAISHLNKIYVIDKNGFEVFDPLFNSWQDLPKLNIGNRTELVSINGKLLAFGNENKENKSYKLLYEIDTTNNSWHKLLDIDELKIFHAMVVNLSHTKL